VKAFADLVADTPAVLVVDAISGLAGQDLRTDDWNIDVVVGGSQKGLMTAPGLAMVSWLAVSAVTIAVSLWQGVTIGLQVVLGVSLLLQIIVLGLAVMGSKRLHFEKSGYWVRVGSSLMHLGLILFVFDLFFFRYKMLHLVLFWITTIVTVIGMLFCFYSATVTKWIKKLTAAKSFPTELS